MTEEKMTLEAFAGECRALEEKLHEVLQGYGCNIVVASMGTILARITAIQEDPEFCKNNFIEAFIKACALALKQNEKSEPCP